MINRTPDLLAELTERSEEFSAWVAGGLRSVRMQWNVDGHADPLTLYANAKGTFIVAPGEKSVLADEWLSR